MKKRTFNPSFSHEMLYEWKSACLDTVDFSEEE